MNHSASHCSGVSCVDESLNQFLANQSSIENAAATRDSAADVDSAMTTVASRSHSSARSARRKFGAIVQYRILAELLRHVYSSRPQMMGWR